MPSLGLGCFFSELDHKTWDMGQTRGWLEGVGSTYPKSGSWVTSGPRIWVPTNARATGEVIAAWQSSNNDKGDVENTIQVLAE
jgi:hypothetical protein